MKYGAPLLASLLLVPAALGQVRHGPVAEGLDLPKDPMFSKRMKKTLAIPALPGNSLANGADMGGLRRDVAAGILQLERQLGNTGSTIVTTKVATQPATPTDLTKSSWTESWVAQRSKKQFVYLVSFVGQGKKGIGYSITPQT